MPSVWSHYDAARCLRKAIVRDLALSMPERVLDDFGGAVAVVAAGGFGWAWGTPHSLVNCHLMWDAPSGQAECLFDCGPILRLPIRVNDVSRVYHALVE